MIFRTDDEATIKRIVEKHAREEAEDFCKAKGYDAEKTKEIVEMWIRDATRGLRSRGEK